MRIGVLGTGMVGAAIAGKLVALGHEVTMGSREAGSEKAVAWVESTGDGRKRRQLRRRGRFRRAGVQLHRGAPFT